MQFTRLTNLFKRTNTTFQWSEDRAILFVCMGIAFLFWIFIKLSQEYTAQKPLRFSFELPADKTFTELPPDNLEIELVGTGWELLFEFLNSSSIELDYDLRLNSDIFLSTNRLSNDIRNQLRSRSVNVRSINTDGIRLNLADRATKKIPIRFLGKVNLASGYQYLRPLKLQPDSLSISGAQPLIDSIFYWPTDSLHVSALNASAQYTVDLREAPPTLLLIPQQTNLQVQVEQFTEDSKFVPIEILNPPDSNLKIFPNNLSVKYIVGLSYFEKIKAGDFKLAVDFKDYTLPSTVNKIEIQLLDYPDSIRNLSFSPRTADFFIQKDTTQQSQGN